MNSEKFIINLMDQIKELQIKLGYARETVRLYYPVESLNALFGIHASDAQEMVHILRNHPDFSDSHLGTLDFCVYAGRIQVSIPAQGVEYVHEKMETPAFLSDIVLLFQTNHHCTLNDVKAVFEKYSKDYVCEKMPEGTDFDYCMHFKDAQIDAWYYCIKKRWSI